MAGTWIDLPAQGGGGSAYWKDAVATTGQLPPGGADGEVRMVLATHELYYWNAGNSDWELVPTSQIDPSDVSDTDSVDLTVTAGVLSADVRLSSDAADTGYIAGEISIQSGASPGLRSQVANSLVRSLFDGDGTYIGYDDTTGVFSLVVSAVLALLSSTTDDITYNNANGQFTFNPGNVDHATLANLLADSHTQYALLAGRAGGQTLTGGTASGNSLTLGSTSNSTKGKVVIQDPIQLPLLTTTQINALTPSDGMLVYDTTINRPKFYVAGTTNAWVQAIGWGNP